MNELQNHRGSVSPSVPETMGFTAWLGIIIMAVLALVPLMIAERHPHSVPLKTREELRKDLDHIYIPAMPKKGKP